MTDSLHARIAATAFVMLTALMIADTFSPGRLQGAAARRDDVERPDVLAYAEELGRGGQSDREKAADAIRAARAQLITRLMQLAKEPSRHGQISGTHEPDFVWHEPKHLAILLLGDLRAAEAVPVLVENLEYKNPRQLVVSELLDKDGWYPAVEALSRIGMPAVDPIVNRLGQLDPGSKNAELCSWILKKVLGVKLARARIHLAIEETHDATAKKNLQAALPGFVTSQEKAEEERRKSQ